LPNRASLSAILHASSEFSLYLHPQTKKYHKIMNAKRQAILLVLCIALMVACNVEKKSDGSTVNMDKYMMIEELPDTAIEHIRQSIAAADTLDSAFLYQEVWDDPINPEAFRLMDRTMRLSFNYDGRYTHAYEWAAQDTAKLYFLNYLQAKGKKVTEMDSVLFRQVVEEFHPILKHFYAGSQAEMNAASHLELNFDCLKMIGAYKDMVALCEDNDLRKAYFMDYGDWLELHSTVLNHQEGGYSMFPLLANGFGSEMMMLRTELLREEMAMKREGKPISWEEKAIDWKAENGAWLLKWYDHRMEWADKIADKEFAKAFKAMTNKVACLFLKLQFDPDYEGDLDEGDLDEGDLDEDDLDEDDLDEDDLDEEQEE